MDIENASSSSESSPAESASSTANIYPTGIPSSTPTLPQTEYGTMRIETTIKSTFISILYRIIQTFFPSIVFTKFFISGVIPPLADNLIPLFFTGNIPNESGLALAGQFTFIGIILEVIQEGVVNSLFHFVGKHYKHNRSQALQAFKLCLLLLLVLGSLLSCFMLLLTPQFVNFIDTPETIAEATRRFLYTSSLSFPLFLLNSAFTNYLLITTSAWLVIAQLTSVIISFLTNLFLFGQHSWSLQWGVESLGYYKIIQSASGLTTNVVFALLIENITLKKFLWDIPLLKDLKSNFKSFFHISWGNFGDSGVRNFFYFVVTLKFVNNLGENEAGAWNLLNSIVWGILLVPGYTVANYVKVKIGHDSSKHKILKVAKESLICLIAWVFVTSLISSLLWPIMAQFFSKSNKAVQELSTKMFYNVGWIFIIFVFNNAMDSLFLGTGKTQFVFYQSLITNMVVYCLPWILYMTNVLTPTNWWVLGLYIGGMLVDFCLTSYFCVKLWKSIPE